MRAKYFILNVIQHSLFQLNIDCIVIQALECTLNSIKYTKVVIYLFSFINSLLTNLFITILYLILTIYLLTIILLYIK